MANAAVAFDGWNASGVGWGDQPWGEGALDIAATGAVGTPAQTGGASANVTGVEGVTAVGQVTVQGAAAANVTGVECIGEAGSLGSVDVSVTGVQATGQLAKVLVWGPINDNNVVTWDLVNDNNAVTWTTILT